MPITTTLKPTSVKHHPFNLTYIFLWLGALVLRHRGAAWRQKKELDRQLKTVPDNVVRRIIKVPSREVGRTIEVHVYEQKEGGESGKTNKPRAVHVNFHGSGFILPSLGTDTSFCGLVSSRVGCIVLDSDYRKSPEYPFPAALEDAEDVIAYILSNPSTFDVNRITVGGFSAGGNIALSLAATQMGKDQCRGVIGIYANPDMTRLLPAPDKEFVSGSVLPPWLRKFFYKCLINPATASKDDLRLSPGLDPSLFPKYVFLACGTGDNLYATGNELIRRLREERGYREDEAVWVSVDKEAHGFDKVLEEGSVTEAKVKVMYDAAVEMIRTAQA